jgi:O-antigen/teichoic acid export membrane protein
VRTSIKDILGKILYAISANMVNLLISIILSFVVPKFLGTEQYGYWQLYMFYIGYVGFLHFGWADGLFLRYGGKYYNELDKSLMHSQYWLLAGLEIIVFLMIFVLVLLFGHDEDKMLITIAAGLNCILILPKTALQYLLQGTGRVKEFARNRIGERILYAFLVVVLLVFGYRSYKYILLADVIAKVFATIGIAWACKDIVLAKGTRLSVSIKEAIKNISVGVKLLGANIAGMLIIGIVRLSIEKTWDISTFGKVSFSLSISNFIMVFISAVSIVIFPIIKRSDEDKLPFLYNSLGMFLSAIMMVFLIFYYPLKLILEIWLPNYVDAISYFSIIFPICLFESRNSLLINTYLKAFRKENALLRLNGVSVVFSILLSFVAVWWLKNLILAVSSIVILLAFRCFISDFYLQKIMKMKYSNEVLWELVIAIAFITANWFIGDLEGWGLYCLCVSIILFFRRKTYFRQYSNFKNLIQ